jgi:4-diphosphocytidyl-2-C-methyl-D-erythritol kinase
MTKITAFSYPKVNLALDILRKTPSGFHEIQTVFHQLEYPRDEITVEECEGDSVEIQCDNPRVPLDGTNTVFKAAVLLKQYVPGSKGVKIFIKKRIPLYSGLGGGASNAVAVLKILGDLWEVDEPVLHRLADQIGMDCAFFFDGGTALGTHFGEKITLLPSLPKDMQFEVIETGVKVSSRDAYSWIDLRRCGKNLDKTEKLLAAIRAGDSQTILKNLHNDFEEFIFKKFPSLKTTNYKLQTLLTGSGGALFACRL